MYIAYNEDYCVAKSQNINAYHNSQNKIISHRKTSYLNS